MSEKALTEAVERLEGEVERRRECDCGSSAPHVPTPGGCTPPAPATPAAMLGEALGLLERAYEILRPMAPTHVEALDMGHLANAILGVAHAKHEAEAREGKCSCECHRRHPDLHCLACAPEPKR